MLREKEGMRKEKRRVWKYIKSRKEGKEGIKSRLKREERT